MPYYIIEGCLRVLVEGRQEADIDMPEWDEWKQYGEEWVKAQWPQQTQTK